MRKLKSIIEFKQEVPCLEKEMLKNIKGGLTNPDSSVQYRYKGTCIDNREDCSASSRRDDCTGSFFTEWGDYILQEPNSPLCP